MSVLLSCRLSFSLVTVLRPAFYESPRVAALYGFAGLSLLACMTLALWRRSAAATRIRIQPWLTLSLYGIIRDLG